MRLTVPFHRGCIAALLPVYLLTPLHASGETARVSGTANIFGAGHTVAPAPGGGGGGVLPPSVTFAAKAGLVLTFANVSGSVSCCEGGITPNGPDGGTANFGSTNINSLNGISGFIHANRTMFLAGVFLDANEPSGAGPARMTLTDPEDFTDVSPLIGQTFFVGDGRTDATGQIQRFHVPSGATRLFLGFVDAPAFQGVPGYYDDNTGSVDAIFSISSSSGSFAQIASGGGWKTALVLVNPNATRATGYISFNGGNGNPLQLPLISPQTGGPAATASFTNLSIAPYGTFVVESEAATSSILVGWADVKASETLAGYVIFRQRVTGLPDSEGTVPLDNRGSPSFVLSYDNTGGFKTGVALANESTSTAALTVLVRDDGGTQLTSSQMTVPAAGHTSFFIDTALAVTAGRRGTVEFRSATGTITGIGLRFSPASSFTSLPIIR